MAKNGKNVLPNVDKHVKGNDPKIAAKAKKRSRMVSQEEPLPGNSKSNPGNSNKKLKRNTARHKIEFSGVESDKAVGMNNNATKALKDSMRPDNTKPKQSMMEVFCEKPKRVCENTQVERVKWTKEFMDKVRKSNTKHKKNVENAENKIVENRARRSKIDKDDKVDKDMLVLQCTSGECDGDGIDIDVDASDLEELDYEDDLSVEEMEMEVKDTEESVPENNTGMVEQLEKAKTRKHPDKGECSKQPMSQKEIDLEEERLLNNLVLQNMMQRFFKEQFKNMENPKGQIKNMDCGGLLSNQGLAGGTNPKVAEIKSPSDTTIYVPALQKRLGTTPPIQRTAVLDQQQIQADLLAQDFRQNLTLPNTQGDQILMNSQNEIANNPNVLISDFVDNIRVEQHPRDGATIRPDKNDIAVQLEEAQRRAERSVVEAEKFRAQIEQPQGNYLIPDIGSGMTDDDFFPSYLLY